MRRDGLLGERVVLAVARGCLADPRSARRCGCGVLRRGRRGARDFGHGAVEWRQRRCELTLKRVAPRLRVRGGRARALICGVSMFNNTCAIMCVALAYIRMGAQKVHGMRPILRAMRMLHQLAVSESCIGRAFASDIAFKPYHNRFTPSPVASPVAVLSALASPGSPESLQPCTSTSSALCGFTPPRGMLRDVCKGARGFAKETTCQLRAPRPPLL